MADIPPYPLYNRTYNLYRLSPLHHAASPLLHAPALRTHAKRLKEQLKGDNVRGVEVDYAAAEDTARLGPLEECNWDLIGDEDAWIDRYRQLVDPDASNLSTLAVVAPDQARGLEVTLEYERQSYNALLLRDPGVTASPDGFTFLPLLLVKMPAPVREVFVNYLRTAFDAHVAPLRLPSTFITTSLETFFRRLTASTSTLTIDNVIRQLNVQLSFPSTTSLLKHIEVNIVPPDVAGFVTRGKILEGSKEKPFAAALNSYLQTHLALDMNHHKVHVSRVSCNSFHLGTDRLKLAAPDTLGDASFSDDSAVPDASAGQLAVHDLLTSLVREASGSGKFLPDDLAGLARSPTPSSSDSAPTGSRKRAISNAATGNEMSKKAKPKRKQDGKRPASRDKDMVDV